MSVHTSGGSIVGCGGSSIVGGRGSIMGGSMLSISSASTSMSLSAITTRAPLFTDPRGVAVYKAREAATASNPVRAFKVMPLSKRANCL